MSSTEQKSSFNLGLAREHGSRQANAWKTGVQLFGNLPWESDLGGYLKQLHQIDINTISKHGVLKLHSSLPYLFSCSEPCKIHATPHPCSRQVALLGGARHRVAPNTASTVALAQHGVQIPCRHVCSMTLCTSLPATHEYMNMRCFTNASIALLTVAGSNHRPHEMECCLPLLLVLGGTCI
jgi:hypothetical protein